VRGSRYARPVHQRAAKPPEGETEYAEESPAAAGRYVAAAEAPAGGVAEGAKWLKLGEPRPLWIFPSEEGTPLDESTVRKVLNKILDKADLHRRGPHQMRRTFTSLLLQNHAPATYVST
jgi:integrase